MRRIPHRRSMSRLALARRVFPILVLIGGLYVARGSLAADGVSFAVSPSRLVFTTAAGQTAAAPLTVYNQSDAALDLELRVSDFLIDDSGSAASTFAVTDWVRTSAPTLHLAPHDQADVLVIVDVPAGAAPGGYQAGVFMTSAPTGGDAVSVSGRLGAAILIDLPPEDRPLRREIQVVRHKLTPEFPDELSLDALFVPTGRTETRVTNVGETFVRAVAVDRYRSWMTPAATQIGATGTTILRASDGRFATSGAPLPWIGPASVTTEIVYERGAQDFATIVVQADAFVIPWRLFGLLAAVLVAALTVVGLRRGRFGRFRGWLASRRADAP